MINFLEFEIWISLKNVTLVRHTVRYFVLWQNVDICDTYVTLVRTGGKFWRI